MKMTAGITVIIAVAITAMRFSGAPPSVQADKSHVNANNKMTPRPAQPNPSKYTGGCTTFDAELPSNSKKDADLGTAKSVIDRFFGLRGNEGVKKSLLPTDTHYVIALVPDPRHTNLSLMFDREMVVIQQAAQDEGYTYDSSWLPWRNESATYPLLQDQQLQKSQTDHREACPGILLFRKGVSDVDNNDDLKRGAYPYLPAKPAEPYKEGLIVLVVGEQPTRGVNEDQWSNAILWLRDNASPQAFGEGVNGTGTLPVPRSLEILGPSFSGSLVSLQRDLSTFGTNKFPSKSTEVHILSGSVSSCSSIRWFQERLRDSNAQSKTVFGSFQENDELQIFRFLNYVRFQGGYPTDIAILSEDETAYANSYTPPHVSEDANVRAHAMCELPAPYNRSLKLSYPRDISALRSAYEKQAVFASPNQGEYNFHPILRAEDAQGPVASDDTIPTFSGEMTAVSQEAILYGLVGQLRSHHVHDVLLRCTNPLDYLFLTRFFHRAYPEGRIVTVGTDLLFQREIDTTEFRGVLSLSNYPLIPRNQHWSRISKADNLFQAHTHRIFESHLEGAYLAARFLFDSTEPLKKISEPEPLGPLVLPFKENIPDYADPFWMGSTKDVTGRTQPPTWLAVLGRDGYWPIAVINASGIRSAGGRGDEALALDPKVVPPPSTMIQIDSNGAHYDRKSVEHFSGSSLFSLPLPWKICIACAVLLLLYQILGILVGKNHTSAGLFAPFCSVSTPSQAFLVGINCAIAVIILTQLMLPITVSGSLNLLAASAPGYLSPALLIVTSTIFILLLRYNSVICAVCFLVLLAVISVFSNSVLSSSLSTSNEVSLFYRMEHLTSGVSPMVPVLCLSIGFYLWTWQAMAGNELLCCGRPLLPKLEAVQPIMNSLHFDRSRWYYKFLGVPTEGTPSHGWNLLEKQRFRISHEMDKRIIKVSSPMSFDIEVIGLPLFVSVCAIAFFDDNLPLLGMEGHVFALAINLSLLIALMLTAAEACRLFCTWIQLKRMLTALNRTRLRRTLAKLQAVDAHSLWSVSGNTYRVQYLFFSQQLDAVIRLADMPGGGLLSVLDAAKCGRQFAAINADRLSAAPRWNERFRREGDTVQVAIRDVFADAVAQVLNCILLPKWKTERSSLSLANSAAAPEDQERNIFDMELSEDETVRTAEEFVSFQYIAFIQNILARMRTMVLSMVCLFVAACFAISFYPFVPRTQISVWMIVNLILIGSVVIYVYAAMERDETLSHITNTKPGHLSGEFWLRTAGFLAAPVIGVLTTQFPAISESILGFLQPGLVSLGK
jgi:hypothetical protein